MNKFTKKAPVVNNLLAVGNLYGTKPIHIQKNTRSINPVPDYDIIYLHHNFLSAMPLIDFIRFPEYFGRRGIIYAKRMFKPTNGKPGRRL